MPSLREVVDHLFDELVPGFFSRSPALPSAGWAAGQPLVTHTSSDGYYLYTEGDGNYQLVSQERGGVAPDPQARNHDRDFAIDKMTALLNRVITKDNVLECTYAGGKAFEIDDQMTTVWDKYLQLVLSAMNA